MRRPMGCYATKGNYEERMERIEERRGAIRHLGAWQEMLADTQAQLRTLTYGKARWELMGWARVCSERIDHYYAILDGRDR